MRRECVRCRVQPEAENKLEGRIFSLYCIGRSKMEKLNIFFKLKNNNFLIHSGFSFEFYGHDE